MRPYPWLVDYLNARLPELEGLRNTPKGLEKARLWFKALLKYFRRRQLKTPRQQKNYVVDVRNAIRSRFGEDHPALKVVGFDEDTWTQINKPIHDRVEDRNQNTRFLKDPDAIVQRAETLLSSKTSTWADLAVGLGVATGRRISELLGYRTKLEQKTDYSVLFTVQLKSRGDLSAKPAKQIKPHNWRISDAAHKILAKDWTLAKDEHQSDVFERVLAFANAAKGLASTMELPVGQIAPETLLDTFTTKFHTLSENLRKASAQVEKLKFDHHQLSAERDALAARVAALQRQIQDAAIRQAPPVELLPFAR